MCRALVISYSSSVPSSPSAGLIALMYLYVLGNLPVERAKDAVCFLQQCGVSLVSSYAVCFLQRGGVSLASSAIIYNIVKVKVTH